ncbi:DUF4864 domain-containing protein [Rhizobiales bacterium]|uniref:DUF4864 domain-containing protein n=1 Tax=Hongsoonwoonella zoysiae TaxID=2821844 RepID=UPI0015617C88|nr:DUF4864 domain-containing protein [Hongsoonwoonella zoysiae]NRG18837.1 DUF4864 domain-containing protein [Hongsoonwoonella zoysiae]
MFRTGWIAFASLLLAAALLIPVNPVAADERSAEFQKIITSQMKAFRSDDGELAFSFAAPVIRQRFQRPEVFLHMVRQGYKPVYRPKSVSFGRTKDTPVGPSQEVWIIDRNDDAWHALYTFEQQPDGSWKISGCYLARDKGEAI